MGFIPKVNKKQHFCVENNEGTSKPLALLPHRVSLSQA